MESCSRTLKPAGVNGKVLDTRGTADHSLSSHFLSTAYVPDGDSYIVHG